MSPTPVCVAHCSSGWAPRPTGRWSAVGSSPLPYLLLLLLPLFLLPLHLPLAALPLPPPPQPRCYWWQPLCLLSQSARDWWEAPPTLPSSTRLSCSTRTLFLPFFRPSLLIDSQPADKIFLSVKNLVSNTFVVFLLFFSNLGFSSVFFFFLCFSCYTVYVVCVCVASRLLPAESCLASVICLFFFCVYCVTLHSSPVFLQCNSINMLIES